MNKQVILVSSVFLGIAIGSSGCFSPPQSVNDVMKITNTFYEKLNNQDYNGTFTLLSDDWFVSMNKSKTLTFFQLINTKLGPMINHTLITWGINQVAGTQGTTETITLKYDVTRTHYMATETFTFIKSPGTSKYYLKGYEVISPGFAQ